MIPITSLIGSINPLLDSENKYLVTIPSVAAGGEGVKE